jgi:hypothetical protein
MDRQRFQVAIGLLWTHLGDRSRRCDFCSPPSRSAGSDAGQELWGAALLYLA